MPDILDKLTSWPCNREPFTPEHAECECRVASAAAREIEKLRSENERLARLLRAARQQELIDARNLARAL